jgi:hypothetical protein
MWAKQIQQRKEQTQYKQIMVLLTDIDLIFAILMIAL